MRAGDCSPHSGLYTVNRKLFLTDDDASARAEAATLNANSITIVFYMFIMSIYFQPLLCCKNLMLQRLAHSRGLYLTFFFSRHSSWQLFTFSCVQESGESESGSGSESDSTLADRAGPSGHDTSLQAWFLFHQMFASFVFRNVIDKLS